MKNGSFLFKSDTIAIKLEGNSTQFLVEHILPLLNGRNDIELICSVIKTTSQADLKENLDQLTKVGVLRCTDKPISSNNSNTTTQFFNNFLEITDNNNPVLLQVLTNYKIAIVGLEAHGAQTILALQQAGINNFKLIDPFICDDDFINTFPFLDKDEATRQQCLQRYLQEKTPSARVEIGPENLTKETLEKFIEDCQLIIVCFDKGFSSIFYWVNQISIDKKIPALYASIKGHLCFVGPFVIPEKTSCYMCYKMRSVAAQEDFEEAMLYEEYLNNQKKPSFSNRSVLPGAINYIACILSGEVLKFIFSFGFLSLPDKIIEFNSLSFECSSHNLLQKPDCPVCQKKKICRKHYSYDELTTLYNPSNLETLFDRLVSTHIGIIKKLELVPKDITEPASPFVYMAALSNHSFLSKEQHQKLNCSGKGLDIKSAKISAVGEAVERYSSTIYLSDEIVFSSYNKFKSESLNPRQLVLYLPWQYDDLIYSPFNANAEIGWVKAYSLVHEKTIYVPAHSTVLNYNLRNKEEYFCQATSNGLAAGATLCDAILSAAKEVIERDAFMITWHNQLPCKRINPLNHPTEDVVNFCKAYKRRGVELRLYQIPTDAPCFVFMAIGVQLKGSGPSIVVGLGADFSATKAARQALLEVGQVRPAFKQRLRMTATQERLKQLLENQQNVEDLEDHDLLYAVPDKLAAFDFLFKIPLTEFAWDNTGNKSTAEELASLIVFLKKQDSDLIYFNLTPLDMEKLGLYTARVIIPDFQPIHFGYKNIRLGGRRLFELPYRLGFTNAIVNVHELNMNAHPLA